MKVIHLSYSDDNGGAFIATKRLHLALLEAEIDSEMWVVKYVNTNGDPKIIKVGVWLHDCRNFGAKLLAKIITKIFFKKSNGLISLCLFGSGLVKKINSSDADVIHLHWIHSEMLSIRDISRIKKPIVWTMHDMWAFCGGEHYSSDSFWKNGYEVSGLCGYVDFRRYIWKYKKKSWKSNMFFIGPSQWISSLASQSPLLNAKHITTIPNTIISDEWCPLDQGLARAQLRIADIPTILFCAIGGKSDLRKGADLLDEILSQVRIKEPSLECNILIMGGEQNNEYSVGSHHFKSLKHTSNRKNLVSYYSAADVKIIPSRQDNLPNTGLEALMCGLPCIGFNVGGLSDIVYDESMGVLVEPFDTAAFADGVIKFLKSDSIDRNTIRSLGQAKFGQDTITRSHKTLYEKALYEH